MVVVVVVVVDAPPVVNRDAGLSVKRSDERFENSQVQIGNQFFSDNK